ncbi:hypothetical protein CHCC20335_0869 [Bacillus paralicheniformis]|nr:hypothetical protein CHCC20335_0869 [Bacillus paralicheniformis]
MTAVPIKQQFSFFSSATASAGGSPKVNKLYFIVKIVPVLSLSGHRLCRL